jgi:hypothetical protein
MVSLQIVMLGAPTSLASIMVIGPHHAAAIHVGGSSEVGQREHMVRQGFSRKCWSEFLCLGDYLAPPRQASRGVYPAGCEWDQWPHLVSDNIAGYWLLVLHDPLLWQSVMSWAPSRGLALWLRDLGGG